MHGHRNRWRQRVAALLAYSSFQRPGVGTQTVWEPQAPAWVWGSPDVVGRQPFADVGTATNIHDSARNISV
ncbi:MAG: hypothetical protein WCI11_14775 [Candidatus Methylumidiphilus sp.]